MKVLHIIDEPYDSGIVQYALRAAHGLNERGDQAQVWGLEGGFPVREAARLGLSVVEYRQPWLSLGALRRRLGDFAPDLAVAHTGSAHTLAVAAAAWRGTRIPVVRVRADARSLRSRPGRRLLWRRTAGFIAANAAILSDHERLYARKDMPAETIHEGAPDTGARRAPMAGAPTIGILARLDPVKGHGDFLEAAALIAKKLPDARFLIVGREENVRASELASRAQKLGLSGRVEIAGHVPSVRPYLDRCHLGVIASTGSEAVSRAAVEWMAAGRPLAATRVGCLPEYVLDGKTGALVPPRDPAALAEAAIKIAGDSFLSERMGLASRARYEEAFSMDLFLTRMRAFYERVLHPIPH